MLKSEFLKEYKGKRVDLDQLKKWNFFRLYGEDEICWSQTLGDDEYSCSVYLDLETKRITGLSTMEGQTLMGDEATHVNYKSFKCTHDYDYLANDIDLIILDDEEEEE